MSYRPHLSAAAVVAMMVAVDLGCNTPASSRAIPVYGDQDAGPESDARTDPGAPCTTGLPSLTAFCAMPKEEDDLEIVSQWSTTHDACTRLYVASRGVGSSVARIRRYSMTGAAPCGFARDEGFAEISANLAGVAATASGTVYALGARTVRRLAPGPAIDCATRDVVLGDQARLVLTSDGTAGYVVWDRYTAPKLARLTTSPGGCELSAFSLLDIPIPSQVEGIAVDELARLHILETNDQPTGAKHAYIVGTGGSLVKVYDVPRDESGFWRPGEIVPCGEGMCITDMARFIAFRSDGTFVATGPGLEHDGWSPPAWPRGIRARSCPASRDRIRSSPGPACSDRERTMSASRLQGALLALAVLAPSAATYGCSSKHCAGVGCSSSVRASLEVPRSAAQLHGARLELCRRGGACTFATFDYFNGLLSCSPTIATESASFVTCDANDAAVAGAASVVVKARFVPRPDEVFADGDAFTLRVTDASAELTFAERAGVVTRYTRGYQNNCDEGPTCFTGTF